MRVLLPPDYGISGRTYPVLYMFDGNNLFDRATSTYGQEWRIGETMHSLYELDTAMPAVVVGIDPSTDPVRRYAEYSISEWIYPDPADASGGVPIIGTGAATADFVVDRVKPWVESHYRVATRAGRVGIGGSSMGGYMSLYLAARHPGLFGVVLAFSAVALDVPMKGHELRTFLAGSPCSDEQRIYVDMGDSEQLEYVESPDVLVASLQPLVESLRESGREVTSRVVAGGAHHEHAWAGRFAEVFRWGFHGEELPG